MKQLVVPELGEGVENAVVACWHYQVGDNIKKSDDIVELVTDKASFNVPSDYTGVLKEILVCEGQTAKIGQALALIET